MKFLRSLQARYMMIILSALFLLHAVYVIIMIIGNVGYDSSQKRLSPKKIEENWHDEAQRIDRGSIETIGQVFDRWRKQYPQASMFWVNQKGQLALTSNVKEPLAMHWTPTYTAKFIKERYRRDPFTVIAFVGKNHNQGFLVLQMPRSNFQDPIAQFFQRYGMASFLGTVGIVGLFILMSFLFFRGIRIRLIHLQKAMSIRDTDALPIPVEVKKQDEIGQLEQAFNQMVFELKESKQREWKEEQLRRELIANLSHDLRTPLTKLQAQAYAIQKEKGLSANGKERIAAFEASINQIDHLIENLMSYTLLMSSKYPYRPTKTNMIRLVRKSLASWYSAFEKEGFELEINLKPLSDHHWEIDPIWFERILDNLFQNVLRHAKSGRYMGVKTEETDRYDQLMISDRGKGMKAGSNEKGAGIGLSIVDMMIKTMGLEWVIETSNQGTTIQIKRKKK